MDPGPATADGWTPALPENDLHLGRAVQVRVSGEEVLLLRTGDRVLAVANRCTHQGAPLHKGVVRADDPIPTVTCPVHGSVFSLLDGAVRRGPAAQPLQTFEARVNDGRIEVRPVV